MLEYSGPRCYYCGEPATEQDHVVPRSWLPVLRPMVNSEVPTTVDCCSECNRILSNSLQDSLVDRVAELKARLRARYRHLLEMPEWTTEELQDLGRGLRGVVAAALVKRTCIERRLDWGWFVPGVTRRDQMGDVGAECIDASSDAPVALHRVSARTAPEQFSTELFVRPTEVPRPKLPYSPLPRCPCHLVLPEICRRRRDRGRPGH
jgi:hypothetical protein